jgi:hypothetical protein
MGTGGGAIPVRAWSAGLDVQTMWQWYTGWQPDQWPRGGFPALWRAQGLTTQTAQQRHGQRFGSQQPDLTAAGSHGALAAWIGSFSKSDADAREAKTQILSSGRAIAPTKYPPFPRQVYLEGACSASRSSRGCRR